MGAVTKVFGYKELEMIDEMILSKAHGVVPLVECDQHCAFTVCMRHDVDHDLEAARTLAHWEYKHGYRSTYFFLHTADYWGPGIAHDGDCSKYNASEWPGLSDRLVESIKYIAQLGHEIGFHNNAIVASQETGVPCWDIVAYEVGLLREHVPVVGTAAHGDPRCYEVVDGVKVCAFTNYEMWEECRRYRQVEDEETGITSAELLNPDFERKSMHDFGFEYEGFYKPRALLLSDSGGKWGGWWKDGITEEGWPTTAGQLHILLHADWWSL